MSGRPMRDGVKRRPPSYGRLAEFIARRDSDLKAWFDSRLDKTSSCWLWQGTRSADGYGCLSIHRKRHIAHRFAWELAYGAIPTGMFVCHHCDTPACCNPIHLFVGTNADNAADMGRKGRSSFQRRPRDVRGENNVTAKLTAAAVTTIRQDHSRGVPTPELARLHGVTPTQIRNIVNWRQWTHLQSTEAS